MRTLFNNYEINYGEWYKCYVDYCKEYDAEIFDENSNEFYKWVYNCLDNDWDDFMLNMKYDDDSKQECVVIGSVGLWYGRFEINAKKFSNLKDAIMACIKNVDYIIIKEEKGIIYITAIHHDGHHSFEIHKLNKKGCNVINECLLENEHYHAKYNLKF